MKNTILAITVAALFVGCGGDKPATESGSTEKPKSMVAAKPAKDVGVGPIKELKLPETIDEALAATGKEIFENKCSACHKINKRFVGPALAGITARREPEWIMNMILNPEGMVAENEAAKALLVEYLSPMANQNLTEEEARSVLEYFRTL
ncbi:MAG: c-type cytochrome [Flavobacteriales bacterium]|nr:c-type cytochrome [Flavobacteriales bacterium]